ncbi:NrsF family protein [Neoaquamicrobium sediminum]|uniref:NrsF family protein n=1 Tax=Neoaquamicrobium sediminum TaxID=1849104 RepID=UPI0040362FE4
MRTDDLIKAIAADTSRKEAPIGRTWLLCVTAGFMLAALVFSVLLGPRPDFQAVLSTIRFPLKFLLVAILLASTIPLVQALARPGARPPMWAALAAPTAVVIAVLVELSVLPREAWVSSWIGTNLWVCLTYIPLIGLGPLAIMIAALRKGAPTRPVLTGAMAGVVAGGVAAMFYAAHCTDDSPLFVAAWYSIAIGILAGVGALAGRYALRW